MNKLSKETILTELQKENIITGYVLAYFYNKVCLGYLKNNDIIFNETVDYNLLQQIRIFNEQMELRYVMDEEKQEFIKSIIKDSDNKDGYIDENMYILGNKIEKIDNDFTVLSQQNKKISIPMILTEKEVKNGIKLIVRNYFKETDLKQVYIYESRLVGLIKESEEQ